MKVLFRADASLLIGTGHIMRCRTLATAFKKKGISTHFITRAHPGHLANLLLCDGHKVSLLPTPVPNQIQNNIYSNWLGVSQSLDAEETIEELDRDLYDLLVVDHYGLDEVWEKRLRSFVSKIMVIDDLANRDHECDILLDQNFAIGNNQRYMPLVPEACRLLLGPQYALLRPEYSQLCKREKASPDMVRRILVFMGGVDNSNITSVVLRALNNPSLAYLRVDIVIGINFIHRDMVVALARKRLNTHIYEPCESLAYLMGEADLAIGAGGATLWERMAAGLPSVVVAVADNQKSACQALSEAGLIWYVGEANRVSECDIGRSILNAVSDPRALARAAKEGKILVDGDGIHRVLWHLL